jgi:hypothetical protein
VTGYRDVLVRLLADVDGIYRRHSEVLGRFEAVEDRMHAARREMEAIDATGAKTPAAVEILDRLIDELGDLPKYGRASELFDHVVDIVASAEAARERARLIFQEVA